MRAISDPRLFWIAALLTGCSGSESSAPPELASARGLVVVDAETEPPAEATHDHGDHAGHDHGGPRPYFHDFGAIRDGETVRHVFRLQNSESVPLTISRMTPSCGCTVPFVSYTNDAGEVVTGDTTAEPEILAVPPGAIVDLGVSIDSTRIREKNVRKLMQVRVTTTSETDPFLTLECSVLVDQPFRSLDGNLKRMPASVGGKASAQVLPVGESGDRIAGLGAVPEGLVANLAKEPEGDVWRVDVEALPPITLGVFQRDIELRTETKDGVPGAPYLLRVTGSGIPDVELLPSQVILRDAGDGAAPSADVKLVANIPGMRVKVLSAEATGSARDSIRVEFEPVGSVSDGRSSEWMLRVQALPGTVEERFSGTVVVRLDDAQYPELTLTYAGF